MCVRQCDGILSVCGRGRGRGDSGGRGNGGRGRGRGNGGRGNGGRGNTNSYVDETTWYSMTWEERQAIIEARKCARSANSANVNGNPDAESTIAGPPTTVNVDNGTHGNNNNNRQANTTNQGSQRGSMIRNMMLSTSACSANASTGARQDEVAINGTTYRSVNNTVRYRISQQVTN